MGCFGGYLPSQASSSSSHLESTFPLLPAALSFPHCLPSHLPNCPCSDSVFLERLCQLCWPVSLQGHKGLRRLSYYVNEVVPPHINVTGNKKGAEIHSKVFSLAYHWGPLPKESVLPGQQLCHRDQWCHLELLFHSHTPSSKLLNLLDSSPVRQKSNVKSTSPPRRNSDWTLSGLCTFRRESFCR